MAAVSLETIERQRDGLSRSGEASPEDAIDHADDLARLGVLPARLPPGEQELVALKCGMGLVARSLV